jgi:hypothetical protein
MVRIVGLSQTTVAVDDGGKRRTFNRSNWYERGSKGNYRPHLMGEGMALFDLNAQNEKVLKRDLLRGVRERLDLEGINQILRNSGTVDVETIQDLIDRLQGAADYARENLPTVRVAAEDTNQYRQVVWGR